jgi:hypothetical protein
MRHFCVDLWLLIYTSKEYFNSLFSVYLTLDSLENIAPNDGMITELRLMNLTDVKAVDSGLR